MHLAGKLKAVVTLACPMGSTWPCSVMIRCSSSRSPGPAAEWMTLSMHLWEGWKQPKRLLLPAFTIAVMLVKVVISPRHSESWIGALILLEGFDSRSMEKRGGIDVPDVRILLLRR